MTDPYERAEEYMAQLEAAMRNVGIWPGEKPDGPLEVKGAFGCENMSFAQWLAWLLIPRVREIVAERGEFPGGSSTAAYAIREFDGLPGAEEVHAVLYAFDQFIRNLKR